MRGNEKIQDGKVATWNRVTAGMNVRTCRSEENTNTRTQARSLHVVKMESKCPRSQGKLDLLWHSNEFWEMGGGSGGGFKE